jgi:hypothetical protein
MRDMDEVTRETFLAPPLRIVQQCRALEPGRVRMCSQVGLVGRLDEAATMLAFLFYLKKLTNIIRDLFIPLAGQIFSFQNRFWDGLFFL